MGVFFLNKRDGFKLMRRMKSAISWWNKHPSNFKRSFNFEDKDIPNKGSLFVSHVPLEPNKCGHNSFAHSTTNLPKLCRDRTAAGLSAAFQRAGTN